MLQHSPFSYPDQLHYQEVAPVAHPDCPFLSLFGVIAGTRNTKHQSITASLQRTLAQFGAWLVVVDIAAKASESPYKSTWRDPNSPRRELNCKESIETSAVFARSSYY